ncbi:MAG: ABC transporter permease [Candidatus Omnitrophica bacterium]|nr:ABC transporter permease [Candidatus Omnitrophota bacterium]MCM8816847.1 ABC transporter permease [Candidatus Omnitrophota bacterium]
MTKIIESLGKLALESILYLGEISVMLFNSMKYTLIDGLKRKKILLEQMVRIGIDSFPLVGIIASFTGMVMVMETAITLKKFGGESFVGGIVSLSMVRELGPIIVALIVAGRVGASVAAEIGSMKITEQIDALEVLGVNPLSYLVAPRLVASMIMVPILTLMANFLSIVGGYIIGVYLVHIGSGVYLYQSFEFIKIKDVFVGIFKSLVFGILIIGASCLEGLKTQGGAEGVGIATTKAVVNSFFLVILANLILTAIFYFL